MKRICAIVLSLAMLISVMPASATDGSGATKEAITQVEHTHDNNMHTCEKCNTTEWKPWENSDSLPTSGHYYLTKDVTIAKNIGVAKTAELHLCLNGYTIKNSSGYMMWLAGKAVICDCTATTGENGTYVAGSISGGNSSGNGGAIQMESGAELYLYGGIITGCESSKAGGAVFVNSAKFYMYGGMISNNNAKNGGAIGVFNGTVELKGGSIIKNRASNGGGAIYASGTSKVTLNGMTVTGNSGDVIGGAIYLINTAQGTITDSTITGNTGVQAIQMAATNNLTLAGATKILGNHNTNNEVSNLYLIKGHPGVDVSGLSEGAQVGVTLASDRISAGQMYITGEMAEGVDPSAYVVSDNNEYEVKLVDKKLVLKQHKHADAIGQEGENLYLPWTDSTSLPQSGNYYLTTDVELSENAALTGRLHLCLNGHKVNLNKNSIWNQTIAYICDCTAKTENGVYTAGSIFGGKGTNGGAVGMKEGTTYVALHLYDGIIENCSATTKGGAVNVPQGAKFYMYGGMIRGCQATNGGAVNVTSGAQFQMTGGTIDNNNATTHGGAIYAESASTVTVSNNTSTITNNTAGKEAGGLYARENSNITIKDSIISGNRANAGSAVTVYGGTLTLDGAAIQENHSNAGYGAVHATVTGEILPEVNLKGGVIITENTVGKEGEEKKASNLYLREYDYYVNAGELAEGAKIGVTMDAKRITGGYTDIAKNLTAEKAAEVAQYFISDDPTYGVVVTETSISLEKGHFHDGVKYERWTNKERLPKEGYWYLDVDVNCSDQTILQSDLYLCLNGHTVNGPKDKRILAAVSANITISDCTAKTEGGVYTAGKLTGAVNTATNSGGGAIFVGQGRTLYLYDGIITGNTSYTFGGGVQVGGTMYMYGGEISGNKACQTTETGDAWKAGGGICIAKSGKLYVSGGTISGNQAKLGGAVYANGEAVVELNNAIIFENEATEDGGVIWAGTGNNVTVENSTITGNAAGKEAGGLYASQSTITITNSTISGNTGKTGSAVTVYGSSLTLNGTTIQNNHSNSDIGYGAVNAATSGEILPEVALVGKVTIQQNTAGAEGAERKASNLYLRNADYYVNAGQLASDARIGVTMEKGRISKGYKDIAKDLSNAGMANCFTSDDDAYAVMTSGTSVYLFDLNSMEYISVQPELTDSIALNFKVRIGNKVMESASGNKPQMTFEMKGKVSEPVEGTPVEGTTDIYTFKYPEIMAQNMADTIKATLTVGSATEVYEYSVMDYCKTVLDKVEIGGYSAEQLAALKEMIVDLVEYGAAVQTYRKEADTLSGYLTEAWRAFDKTSGSLEDLTGTVKSVTAGESKAYQWKGVSLVLKEKVNIRCRFTAEDITGLTAKVTVDGKVVSGNAKIIETGKNGEYYLDVDGIYAYEYGKTITIAFTDGSGADGQVLNYSVNTYLYNMRSYSDANLVPLLNAINDYGDAAVKYHDLTTGVTK